MGSSPTLGGLLLLALSFFEQHFSSDFFEDCSVSCIFEKAEHQRKRKRLAVMTSSRASVALLSAVLVSSRNGHPRSSFASTIPPSLGRRSGAKSKCVNAGILYEKRVKESTQIKAPSCVGCVDH